MDTEKPTGAKTYRVSYLTWILTSVMVFLAAFTILLFILYTPQVLDFSNRFYALLMLLGLVFLTLFVVCAALTFADLPFTRLELSEHGVIFYGTAYRIYTPWENIAMVRWTRFSPLFPSLIVLKEPAEVDEISFEEGRGTLRAVLEKRRWWIFVRQTKATAPYTYIIRIPIVVFRRKDKKEGSIQYFRYYLPDLFKSVVEND